MLPKHVPSKRRALLSCFVFAQTQDRQRSAEAGQRLGCTREAHFRFGPHAIRLGSASAPRTQSHEVLSRDPFRTGATMPFIDFRAGGGRGRAARRLSVLRTRAGGVVVMRERVAIEGSSSSEVHGISRGGQPSTL